MVRPRTSRHNSCKPRPVMSLRQFKCALPYAWGVVPLLFHALPAAATTPDISFEQYKLPNGLDVLLHVDHRVPIAHVEVWYKVGSKDEVPGRTGFAHLFEHMMFEGTKQIPRGGYFKYLSEAGASARNGTTDMDRTAYFETLPASQLELGLWLESSRMGFLLDRPAFGKTFATERDVVENERRQTVEDLPLGGVTRVQLEALFPVEHPYRHEVVGSMADLNGASEADLTDFYNRYYAPGNAVLLVAGDIDAAATKGLIERYFGPITAGPPMQPSPTPVIPPQQAERRLAMEAKTNLPYGQMAWNTVPVFMPGDAELDMLANILGEGKSSRLYRLLVHDLKIAESVSVSHLSRMYCGTFEIDYTPMKGHSLTEVEPIIDEELEGLRTRPPSREEVERAKNQFKTTLLQHIETLSGLASRLLYYDVFAADPAYLSQDLERYEKATPESIGTWAKRILTKNQRAVIDVEPNPNAPIMGRLIRANTQTASDPSSASDGIAPRAARSETPLRTTPDAAFRAAVPPSGKIEPFKVPAVKRFRLKNGLQVILAESHELPLVNMDLIVKTGSSANGTDKAGLASLVTDMLDEGTRQRTATQIASEVARLGATLTTYATWDSSGVALSTLTENLERAISVWADVLLDPTFPEEDLRRVKDNLVSSLALRTDYPPVVANQVFARALWGDEHPFAWPDTGTEVSLRRLRRADLLHFYETFYRPNNAVLAVSGDLTEEQVRTKIEPLLAAWKPKRIPSIDLPKVETPQKPRIVLVDKAGAPQSSIRIGLSGIERKNPDYYSALVANQILGGTFKRLAMNLRETKGWTYGVTSQFDVRRAAGPRIVSGEFEAAHTSDAVKEIIKEINRMRSGDVTSAELADTKSEIIGAFSARFATASQLASQMATLSVYDLPPAELGTFVRQIAAVSLEQVRRIAQNYFRPDNLLVVVVGDRASNEPELSRLATVERRDEDGALIEPAKHEGRAKGPATVDDRAKVPADGRANRGHRMQHRPGISAS